MFDVTVGVHVVLTGREKNIIGIQWEFKAEYKSDTLTTKSLGPMAHVNSRDLNPN